MLLHDPMNSNGTSHRYCRELCEEMVIGVVASLSSCCSREASFSDRWCSILRNTAVRSLSVSDRQTPNINVLGRNSLIAFLIITLHTFVLLLWLLLRRLAEVVYFTHAVGFLLTIFFWFYKAVWVLTTTPVALQEAVLVPPGNLLAFCY